MDLDLATAHVFRALCFIGLRLSNSVSEISCGAE